MVCTFMLIVLPTLLMRGVYAFYCWLTGKKAPVPAASQNADNKKPEAKGVCPYHVVLRLFGMKIPEKKAPQVEEAPVKAAQCPYAA